MGFPAGESQVFGVWRLGWDRDCEKLLHRAAVAAAVEEEESSWVDFLTMSKHSGINAIDDDDDDRGDVRQDDQAMFFSSQCAKPESVSENSSGVGDLSLLKVEGVNIMQSQEGGEHATRHYVRRRRDGDGGAAVAPVQFDCADTDLIIARQTVSKVRHFDVVDGGHETLIFAFFFTFFSFFFFLLTAVLLHCF